MNKPVRPWFITPLILAVLIGFGVVLAPKVLNAIQVYNSNPLEVTPGHVQLGQIDEGSVSTRTINVRNTTKKTVIVENVGASCGCTTTSELKQIPPEATVPLTIKFDSYGKPGKVDKSVWIQVAGYSNRPLTIPLEGFVKEQMRIVPPIASIGSLRIHQTGKSQQRIIRLDGKDLKISKITAPSYIKIDAHRLSPSELTITAFVTAPPIPGKHEDIATVYLNHPGVPKANIPVHFEVASEYKLAPQEINMGMVKASETVQSSIQIDGLFKTPVTVVSKPEGMSINLRRLSATSYIIETKFTVKGGTGNFIKSQVVLRSGNPRQELIIIPVYAAVS